MVKNMKKIIVLGVFASICIILMSSSASAIEYKTIIQQNSKEIISQETTNEIKTVSEKLKDLIPTMDIGHRIALILLLLKCIKVILSQMKGLGIPIKILLLRLIIKAIFNRFTFIKLIRSMIRTTSVILGLILINILKIIRSPFKLISKSITLLIQLIRVIILSSIIRIGLNHSPLIDITGKFSNVIT